MKNLVLCAVIVLTCCATRASFAHDGYPDAASAPVVKKTTSLNRITPELLLSLSNSIPADVWLQDLKADNADLHLDGRAVSYPKVSDFMRDLDKSAKFSMVKLENTATVKDESGNEVIRFRITATRR